MSCIHDSHLQTRQAMDALLEVARNHPDVKLLLVFGSQARGDATPESDLDVIYMADGPDRDIYSKMTRPLSMRGQKHTMIPHNITDMKKQ